MTAPVAFFDTNIVVYLVDTRDPLKQAGAQALLASREPDDIRLSTQVLGEFFTVVTRKLPVPLDTAHAEAMIEQFCQCRVQPVDGQLVRAAVARCRGSQLSYWDALIVESAIASGAALLYTEDLSHGQWFGPVKVHNPFFESKESR